MSMSVWGVDHGVEISKANKKFNRNEKVGGALSALHPVVGGVYAGNKAKKGKGGTVGLRAGARSTVEGTAGGAFGGVVGSVLGRGHQGAMKAGATVGGLGGFAHGGAASMRNSRRKGWMKKKG